GPERGSLFRQAARGAAPRRPARAGFARRAGTQRGRADRVRGRRPHAVATARDGRPGPAAREGRSARGGVSWGGSADGGIRESDDVGGRGKFVVEPVLFPL